MKEVWLNILSRKFLFAWMLVFLSGFMCWKGKISGDNFERIVLGVAAAYLAANVISGGITAYRAYREYKVYKEGEAHGGDQQRNA